MRTTIHSDAITTHPGPSLFCGDPGAAGDPSACTVRRGSGSFCDELATNVAATSYTHADPDPDRNYYWVVACNSSGCSPVDSSNPATTVGTPPATSTAVEALYRRASIVI